MINTYYYSWPLLEREEKIFNRAFDSFESLFSHASSFKFNEKNQEYSTEINVAGYKKNEISIEIENDFVKTIAKNEKYGKSSRIFHLESLDPESIQAVLEDGILKLSAKKISAKRPRRIEIH